MATQVVNAPVNIINEKDRDLEEGRNKVSIKERDKDLEEENKLDELEEERQRLLQGGIAADFRSEPVESSISLETRRSKKVKLPEDGGTLATGGGRFTIGPAPDEPWEMVPPDGRWGWCILVGATLVNILIPGTIKSFGVLFLEFLEVFKAGQASASGIPALCYFLYSSLGPISSILSVRWSYRTVTLIGGSFAAFGMILSSFAWSIGYLYFSFGALVGTGAGLAFPPTVYIVTSYFVRLRGLANGICMSGSAFGSIILPPVLRYLLETFGYRGAVLLMGGLMLNVWAAALLFQPVESHLVRKYKEIDDEDGQLETVNEEEADLPQITTTADSFSQPESTLNTVTSSNTLKNKNSFVRSTSAASSNGDLARALSRNKLSQPKITSHNYSNASLALEAVPEGKLGMGSKEFGRKLSYAKPPKRSPSTSSFQYVSTPFHGSTLSAFEPNEFASQFSLKSVTDSVKPIVFCCWCCKKEKTSPEHPKEKEPNKYFDVSLLRDPTYLVILLSVCSVAISYTNFIILLPTYAQSLDFSKTQGAYLLSIVSAFDLIGRIGGSAISDLNLLPKTWYFVGGLLLSGISLALLPFFKSYVMCSVMCGVFGLASGTNTGVTTLVMAEKLGSERLMSTYGISLFVNGILQLIGPVVFNLWYEQTRSYFLLFITLGLIFIAGSSLWGFMPLISRRKREKEMRLNEHDCSKA